MATKTKNQTVLNNLNATLKAAGVVMMTAAATLLLVELPHHEEKERRAVVPVRPVFEFAGSHVEQGSEPQRREREETGPHYTSYGVAQRSPARAGRV